MCLQDEIESKLGRSLTDQESDLVDELAVFLDNDSGEELTASLAISTLELK